MRYFLTIFILLSMTFGFSEEQEKLPVIEPKVVAKLTDSAYFTTLPFSLQIYVESSEVPKLPERLHLVDFWQKPLVVEKQELEEKKFVYIHTYELIPKRVGQFIIPAITVQIGEKELKTKQFSIKVSEEFIDEKIQLKQTTPQTSYYVGEVIDYRMQISSKRPVKSLYNLKFRSPILSQEAVTVFPNEVKLQYTDDKFISVPVNGQRIISDYLVKVDGADITVTQRFSADNTGKIVLKPLKLSADLVSSKDANGYQFPGYFNNSFFDQVAEGISYEKIVQQSTALELEIKPLPTDGATRFFTGYVGSRTYLTTKIEPAVVEVGKVAKLEVTLKNVKNPVAIKSFPWTEQYAIKNNFWFNNKSIHRKNGKDSVTWSVFLRPLYEDATTFPGLSFQYFDPRIKKYLTTSSPPITLKMKPLPPDQKDFDREKMLHYDLQELITDNNGNWDNFRNIKMDTTYNTIFNNINNYWALWLLAPAIIFLLIRPKLSYWQKMIHQPDFAEAMRMKKRLFKADKLSADEFHTALQKFLNQRWKIDSQAITFAEVDAFLAKNLSSEDYQTHSAIFSEYFNSIHANSFSKKSDNTVTKSKVVATLKYLEKSIKMIAIIAMFSLFSVQAETAEEAWTSALEIKNTLPHQAHDKFIYAAKLYEKEVETNQIHAGKLYYNAGNAWYEAGNYGQAIFNYRQALKLEPMANQIIENLNRARIAATTQSQIVIPFHTKNFWKNLFNFPLSHKLFSLAIINIMFWLALSLRTLYPKKRSSKWLIQSITVILIAHIFVITIGEINRKEQGVITNSYGSISRKGPSANFAQAFETKLPNGTEFTVTQRSGDWMQITLADTRVCWIKSDDGKLFTD